MPEAPGEHRRLVREDVAEQVLGDDDVEVGRPADEQHRARIDELVVHLDVRHAPALLVHDPPPETRRREDVGLVDAGQAPTPQRARTPRPRGRSAGSRPRRRAWCRRRIGRPVPPRLPAAPRNTRRRSARGRSGGRRPRGAPAGAATSRSSAGWTLTGRRFAKSPSPPRSANRACSGRTGAAGSDHFGPPTAPSRTASALPARLDVLGPDRDAVRVDRDAAGHDLRPVDREPEPLSGGIDDPPRGVDDLGPDPVARDGDDAVRGKATLRHGRPSPARRFANATSTPLISAPWSLLVATR